jgi:hypothetical protein
VERVRVVLSRLVTAPRPTHILSRVCTDFYHYSFTMPHTRKRASGFCNGDEGGGADARVTRVYRDDDDDDHQRRLRWTNTVVPVHAREDRDTRERTARQ